jgi:hypothetical protein
MSVTVGIADSGTGSLLTITAGQSTVLCPDVTVSKPPTPLSPVPTVMLIAPPLPAVAAPDPMETEPVVPELVVPELKTNTPLTPAAPALALRTVIAPLVVATPCPLVIANAPPV